MPFPKDLLYGDGALGSTFMNSALPTDAIGANIKGAREAKGWSQGDLSASLRVSVQAISQWETGKTLPSLDNIMAAAELLGVHPGVLLWGAAFETKGRNTDYWPRLPIIPWHIVPRIDIDDFDNWNDAIKGGILGYLTPTSRRVSGEFALLIEDASMMPDFRKGDHVIIDFPRGGPSPGDYVIAIVPPDFSNVNDHAILRKLQIQHIGKKIIHRLVPSNNDFPTLELKSPKDGAIVGVVVEQRRYHQTLMDYIGMTEDELDQEEIRIEEIGIIK